MTRSRTIVERQKLNPSQLRTVAERRLGDAYYLQKSKLNVRANGTIYLGGFVIECLLKANLLEEHPWLQSVDGPPERNESERDLWFLCFRRHDLGSMLDLLPRLAQRLDAAGQGGQSGILSSLKSICAEWTIQWRYSTQMATMQQANEFISMIEEVKPWLK